MIDFIEVSFYRSGSILESVVECLEAIFVVYRYKTEHSWFAELKQLVKTADRCKS